MTQLPLLIAPNFFLFPQCNNKLSFETNPHWKEVLFQAAKNHQGKLLVLPRSLELNANQPISTAGTLTEISLPGITTDSPRINC